MGISSSSVLVSHTTPISISISVENNRFLTNLIKIENNNERGLLSPSLSNSSLSSTSSSNIVNKKKNNNNINNKPFSFSSSFKRIKNIKKEKKQKKSRAKNNNNNKSNILENQDTIINTTTTITISINKLLPEYLILKIIKLSCDVVFPSKTFMNISMVCRLWFKLSVKCIRHLYYQHKYLYENDKELNYCRIIGRWLTKSNHYSTINRIQAIYLKFGLDQLGFCFLVPYLIKCPTLRLLRIEFTNGLNSIERVNTICQILQLNKHIRVLNLSNNIIVNSKSIQSVSTFFESKYSSSIKEFIYRKSKLCSLKFSTLLESITKLGKVTIINFSNNEIGNDNLDVITHCLSNSKSLQTINLSKNNLNTSSIHLIIQACINNHITKNLDLRFNNFDLPTTDRESFFLQYSSKFDKLLI